jgi:UDP-N-acetylglucosamine--N-acetylmuramyl-(pentapeptide) pyrophosphoryl-undecaprenol N-acetylglucosamine transferase
MGGFPALPGGLYAWMSRTPLVIHEQNAVLGLTNKVLATKANLLLSGFPNVYRPSHTPTVTVGNPVRAALVKNPLPRLPWSERSGALQVVVIGGSRGAKALNDAVPQAMAMIPEAKRPVLTHQTGKDNAEAVRALYRELGVIANVVEFIDDMAAVYAQADLLICRSGASTVAELAVTGMPSILVPYPYHSDEQQLKNAHYLADAGAATLLEQKQLTPATLAAQLQTIDRNTLQTMSAMAQALGQPLASQQIVDAIQQHLGVGP